MSTSRIAQLFLAANKRIASEKFREKSFNVGVNIGKAIGVSGGAALTLASRDYWLSVPTMGVGYAAGSVFGATAGTSLPNGLQLAMRHPGLAGTGLLLTAGLFCRSKYLSSKNQMDTPNSAKNVSNTLKK